MTYRGNGNEEKRWITYKYFASEVNVVLSGNGTAEVLVGNKPLSNEYSGNDLIFKNGRSFVKIDSADLNNLVKTKGFNDGILKIIPFKGLKVYAFTFGWFFIGKV